MSFRPAARQFFERRGATAWTNPYVTDGLVAMWDGEWNAGGGVHDANATTWKDLVGDHDLSIVSGAQTITPTSVVFNENHLGGKLTVGVDNIVSLEFCGSVAGTTEMAIFCARDNPSECASTRPIFTLWFYQGSLGMGNFKNGYILGTNIAATIYGDNANDTVDNFKARAFNGVVEEPSGVYDYFGSKDTIGFSFRNQYPFNGEVFSFRIYSRALSASEIAANSAIDKARFNLP